MGDETNPDVGFALEDTTPQAPPDRSQNGIRKFFQDPKNIATALIFGAALAQPRQAGNDALGTLLQRAAGAAAFRGGLEAGTTKAKLQREQTAFERAQAEKANALRQEQIDVANRTAGAEEQRNANMLTDAALRSQTEIATQAMRDKLERDIRGQRPEMSEGDYIKLATDMVPHLLQTMEFDEKTSPQEKMRLATKEAFKSVTLMRNALKSGAKVVTMPDGTLGVDDGMGPAKAVPTTAATKPKPEPIPTPKPAPKPDALPTPPGFVGPMPQTFAPSLGQRIASFFSGGGARETQEERDFPTKSLFPAYLEMFRQGVQQGSGYDREAIGMLGRLGDSQLQTMGMSPQEIQTLRTIQQGL